MYIQLVIRCLFFGSCRLYGATWASSNKWARYAFDWLKYISTNVTTVGSYFNMLALQNYSTLCRRSSPSTTRRFQTIGRVWATSTLTNPVSPLRGRNFRAKRQSSRSWWVCPSKQSTTKSQPLTASQSLASTIIRYLKEDPDINLSNMRKSSLFKNLGSHGLNWPIKILDCVMWYRTFYCDWSIQTMLTKDFELWVMIRVFRRVAWWLPVSSKPTTTRRTVFTRLSSYVQRRAVLSLLMTSSASPCTTSSTHARPSWPLKTLLQQQHRRAKQTQLSRI